MKYESVRLRLLPVLLLSVSATIFGDIPKGREVSINEHARKTIKLFSDTIDEKFAVQSGTKDKYIHEGFLQNLLAVYRASPEKADLTQFFKKHVDNCVQAMRDANLFMNLSRDIVKKIFNEYIKHRVSKAFNVDDKKNIGWCDMCPNATRDTRFYFTLHMLNQLAIYKHKDKEFHYLSFGSGNLLQEYLMIRGLLMLGFWIVLMVKTTSSAVIGFWSDQRRFCFK